MDYTVPVQEQLFVLETIADIGGLTGLQAFEHFHAGDVEAVLEEGAKIAERVLAPLNRKGDIEGARWSPEGVSLPDGFAQAYAAYREGGWGGLAVGTEHGGQGLPFALSVALSEQVTAANMAFSLCMILTAGAIEAISAHGSETLRQSYLPQLVSGRWTGTMNLTEPQAGSDVGALRTMATPASDGSWRIKGQKIFITWGDHDLAENIVHLVLARTPGSPSGTKGISLFVVPKYLPNDDGTLGAQNDLRCISLERKLGIHASPTCTMSFGDEGACVGFMVGDENSGMKAMFTMMNHARVSMGVQGIGIADRARQAATRYASERIQSTPIGSTEPAAIINHMDVRRMLMTLRATTEASRAITYLNASAIDRARGEEDAMARHRAKGLADLLTPITKAYATDIGVEMASLAIQVFGGTGYIEETGVAQLLRDIRIAPIYEGTNGIQALDLVGRKLRLDNGEPVSRLLDEMQSFLPLAQSRVETAALVAPLTEAIGRLRETTSALQARDPAEAAAGATPYLRQFAVTLGGYLLLRQAVIAASRLTDGSDDPFLRAKIATARFFIEDVMAQEVSLSRIVLASGRDLLFALANEELSA
ncbi:alkylation response protein AidB-like acyl-CoA dehydrogenase [Sphingobium wenxiniae]|uniref:3-methylmercaptopropionyl-CoA dehydrogenase n=1 Tax=Sphingobium wenxiniae (strain DSM 21828 / CGMCC 1.7748 / JZ-1) TaxID=595605 RepID=A0A562K860_SPHWJ|nr:MULTISPECIES: acyl-CoA dehydrogenase [Sphingobium]MBB6193259.1 alkylation response protein AidB-like acyl-CoA dehydrogenase [Sphingobium wenxiniae]TWH91424.1 acyl-CoA dehydrogenase [Sphingobium wenxiniae]WRD75378.1 acyl-CoA dehydrogenase [Sphingobium baderi]